MDNEVIQMAAKARFPFHVQDILNGKLISNAQHNGSHDLYTGRVKLALEEIGAKYGSALTPEIAYEEIVNLTNRIKKKIDDNPTTAINDLIF